jgi:diketogulonate reductase-like aldo/keto reductase
MAAPAPLPTVRLPDGTRVPALGMGTWTMGEKADAAAREADALRAGLGLGMALVDTAEMYGEGGAEEVVARAIAGRRDDVFLVSKVYPHNASATGTVAACERSLARLRTDRLDLYLLHWRGAHPLAETVAAFERLRTQGKIARWGVSNFDAGDMRELLSVPGGDGCAANQVLYNIGERGIEWDLLPRERKLSKLAAAHAMTAAQLAIAWLLAGDGVIAIPQSSRVPHLAECRAAANVRLAPGVLADVDAAYPPPTRVRHFCP